MNFGPRYPLTFGTLIATAKTAAADILVQKFIEDKEELDWKRIGLIN